MALRTMMFGEISVLLAHQPELTNRGDYRQAVVDFNVLGKPTKKARELTFGHLVTCMAFRLTLPYFVSSGDSGRLMNVLSLYWR